MKKTLVVLIAVTLLGAMLALATSSSWMQPQTDINATAEGARTADGVKSKSQGKTDRAASPSGNAAKENKTAKKTAKGGATEDASAKGSAADQAGINAKKAKTGPPSPSCPDSPALQSRIDQAPDGATIQLSGAMCLDRRLNIADKKSLTLAGDGSAILRQGPESTDKLVVVTTSADVTMRNLEIAGASRSAGNVSGAYKDVTATSAAIALKGVAGFTLENSYIHDVYGDFVDIDTGPDKEFSTDVTIRGNRFERNGRMGISTGENVRNATLVNNTISDVRLSAFDLEPGTSDATTTGVRILDNRVSNFRHYFLSVGGVGNFDGVRVSGNQVRATGGANGGLGFVRIGPRKAGRPPVTGFTMCRNSGDLIDKNTLSGAVNPATC